MPRARLASLTLLAVLAGCGDSKAPSRPEPPRPPTGSDLERAQRIATRPLTAKDVEDYLVLEPLARAARVGKIDMVPHLEKQGVDARDWATLRVRIGAAYQGVRLGHPVLGGAVEEADMEVVKPYAGRIEEALRTK